MRQPCRHDPVHLAHHLPGLPTGPRWMRPDRMDPWWAAVRGATVSPSALDALLHWRTECDAALIDRGMHAPHAKLPSQSISTTHIACSCPLVPSPRPGGRAQLWPASYQAVAHTFGVPRAGGRPVRWCREGRGRAASSYPHVQGWHHRNSDPSVRDGAPQAVLRWRR